MSELSGDLSDKPIPSLKLWAKEVINETKTQGEHPVLLASSPVAQRSVMNRAVSTTPYIASRTSRIGYRRYDGNRRARMGPRTRNDIEFVLLLALLIVVLGVAACLFGPWFIEIGEAAPL
jgi:hypothetical protein